MKNWIIVLLVLILPMIAYFNLSKNQKVEAVSKVDTEGKARIIKFSSSMCLDCQKLQKVFVIIEPKYSNSVFFEHINAQSNDSEVQKMIKDYSVTVVPTMIFINKNGQFIEKTEGYVPQDKLEQKIKALIGNG